MIETFVPSLLASRPSSVRNTASPCKRSALGQLSSNRVPQRCESPRRLRTGKRNGSWAVRAASDPQGESNASHGFDLRAFVEASVDSVRKADPNGHAIFLRIKDGAKNMLMPVFVGDFECSALVQQINQVHSARPMTHDLMKSSLASLGFRVTKVAVTSLVGRTYHARVHYSAMPNGGSMQGEVDVDARPSDAINLAIRFDAPIYINRDVASKMAHPAEDFEVKTESVTDIERSCREDMSRFPDPTLQLKLKLQLAITAERYAEAVRLRNEIDKLLAGDRALSLVVAIETALEDRRYEEAQKLRDELRQMRMQRFGQQLPETQDA